MSFYISKLYDEMEKEIAEIVEQGTKANWDSNYILEMCSFIEHQYARDAAFGKNTVRIVELTKKEEMENEINILDTLIGGDEIDFEDYFTYRVKHPWVYKIKNEKLRKVLICLCDDELDTLEAKYFENISYTDQAKKEGKTDKQIRKGGIKARKYAKLLNKD